MSKIIFENVHKSFGRKHVLNGLSLHIEEGESLVIIGGSGSGKSVTLKCLLGLLPYDQGSIRIDDKEVCNLSVKGWSAVRKKMGMLFQGGALFDSLTVAENISFGLVQNGTISHKEAEKIAEEKSEAVGLRKEVLSLYPAELSGGMQKRVALARAIATNPEIIFFDEPTTGLDPIMSDKINDLIISSSKSLGATTLTITHDMASAKKIADRIAMLYKGQIIWQGRPEEMETSDNPYLTQFINGQAQGPIRMDVHR